MRTLLTASEGRPAQYSVYSVVAKGISLGYHMYGHYIIMYMENNDDILFIQSDIESTKNIVILQGLYQPVQSSIFVDLNFNIDYKIY
jgi:hypothetical protein